MKKLILFTIVGSFSTIGCAQKTNNETIPDVVKQSFSKEYANAKEIKWEKEDDQFEVNFDLNGTDYSVLYDSKGSSLEVEVEIDQNKLPQNALDYLAKNYPGQKIKESATITSADGTLSYEAEVKGQDLFFDAEGNFIKK